MTALEVYVLALPLIFLCMGLGMIAVTRWRDRS